MADSLHLGLPYIAAAQAQKHITHNEALRSLDALVMLSVLDRDLSAPPGSPAEGARYLVKATGTGAFAGKDGKIAHFRDGTWGFHAPRAGWIAYVADEQALIVYDGSAWQPLLGAAPSLQNVTLFGLAATADATNPISAVLNNVLFAARTVANGGDGDLRYKLSKASAADTASFLFQDNFSGRAEIGLAGDDDLHLKVSSDGTTWREGLVIAAGTGKVSFPQGAIGLREKLTANRTYYVRSADGSDSNDGLTNSSGGAFLTAQKAIDAAVALDLSIYSVTIRLVGNFTETPLLKSYLGAGPIIILGDETTPSNVTITGTGSQIGIFQADGVPVRWDIRGVKLTSSSGQNGIYATNNSVVKFQNVEFGAMSASHLNISDGSVAEATGNYLISGGAVYHYAAVQGGVVRVAGRIVTISSTPAFSGAFAYASSVSAIRAHAMTFAGTGATGPRYLVDLASAIRTAGGGANYFPGNAAGTADAASYGAYN
jgi:hypothetical protein